MACTQPPAFSAPLSNFFAQCLPATRTHMPIHISMHRRICTRIYTHSFTNVYTCMHTRPYPCLCTCLCTPLHTQPTHVGTVQAQMAIHMRLFMPIHVSEARVHAHAYTHSTHMSAHMPVYMHPAGERTENAPPFLVCRGGPIRILFEFDVRQLPQQTSFALGKDYFVFSLVKFPMCYTMCSFRPLVRLFS